MRIVLERHVVIPSEAKNLQLVVGHQDCGFLARNDNSIKVNEYGERIR